MFKIQWEARVAGVIALAVSAAAIQALLQPAPPSTQRMSIIKLDDALIELPTSDHAGYLQARVAEPNVTPRLFCDGKLYGYRDATTVDNLQFVVLERATWRSLPSVPGRISFLNMWACRDGHVIAWGVQGDGSATSTSMAEFDVTAQRATGREHQAPKRLDSGFVMTNGNLTQITRENSTWVLADLNGATLAAVPTDDPRAPLFRRTGELFAPGVVDAWHEQLLGKPSQWWTESNAPDGGSRIHALGAGVEFDLPPSGDAVIVKGSRIGLPSCEGRLRGGVLNTAARPISTAAGGVRIPRACGYVEFDQQWHRTDAASWSARIVAAFGNTDWLANLRVMFALLAPFVVVAAQRFAPKRDGYVALILLMLPLQLWAAWGIWFWRSGM